MFCKKCGAQLTNDVKFCKYCGTYVETIQRDDNNKQYYVPQKHKKILVGCAILAIVFLSVFLNREEKAEDNTNDVFLRETTENIIENNAQSMIRDKNNQGMGTDNGIVNTDSDVDGQEIISNDIHSIWFDGIEFKVLKYLDEEKMLVKFPLHNYLVQTVVPRDLENGQYVSEYYIEKDYSGENIEVHFKLINKDKEDAIFYECALGADITAAKKEEYSEKFAQINDDTIFEVQTMNNGSALVQREKDYITYNNENRWLTGYRMVAINEEEQMVFTMEILDESKKEADKSYFEQIAFRKIVDSDYVMKASTELHDYDIRIDSMYQKYEEIIKGPDKYLQGEYGALGNNYDLHYLWDFNEDNIPEIIFLGNPKSILIIGEKNAVSINGSSIIFSNLPNVIYTSIVFTRDVTWSMNEVQVDAQGYLVVNELDSLEADPAYEKYRHGVEDISKEEYLKRYSEIDRLERPKPKIYNIEECVADKNEFQRSVQCMNNDYVYNSY